MGIERRLVLALGRVLSGANVKKLDIRPDLA
jgi:hypothetical protein